MTVQAEIPALIAERQSKRGTAVLLITHDMGVVAETADRVLVLGDGRALERAPVAELFAAPKHAYAREPLDVVAGIFTDQCVSSTVRSLADESFGVLVVEDACAAATDELHEAALKIIDMIHCHVVRAREPGGIWNRLKR